MSCACKDCLKILNKKPNRTVEIWWGNDQKKQEALFNAIKTSKRSKGISLSYHVDVRDDHLIGLIKILQSSLKREKTKKARYIITLRSFPTMLQSLGITDVEYHHCPGTVVTV